MTLVLDSSAVLAALRHEPGTAVVEAAWDVSVIGATNHAEVVTKLIERGLKPAQVDALLDISPPLPVIPLDKAQATTAGLLRAGTRHLGLSLGDRA